MLRDVAGAIGRRWYVVLVGLLATAGLVYGAYSISPPEYNARGLVLLLPSQKAVGEGGNPFLELSGLEQPAGIVVAYFGSASAREEVKALSETAKYIVGIEDSTRGPVIAVDVTDETASATLGTLNYLADRIPEELQRLQSEVDTPQSAAIRSMTLTIDREAKVDSANTVRTVIAAGAVGIVATGFIAFGVDGLLGRRANRRPTEPKAAQKNGRKRVSHATDVDDQTHDDVESERLLVAPSGPRG